MKCLIISLLLVQFLSTNIAYADEKSEYEQAVAAIDVGDCKTALPLLREYKIKNEVKLKAYKDFERNINLQIENCEKIIKISTIHLPQPSNRTKIEGLQSPPLEKRLKIMFR